MGRKMQKGQALVEFALTVPIFLMFVFGIIDLARAMFGFAQVADASRQAVRYGIVKGLDAAVYQYIDCAGIQDAAADVPGLLSLDNSNIDVSWEDSKGDPIAECGDAVTHHDVQGGDVLVVRVHTELMPLTPVLMMFDSSILIDYETRRTITENVAATDEWKDPPPAPTGFDADVDCSLATNNVSFTWDIMDVPDRIEIREVITGLVVAEPDPNNAYCNNCATISPTDGFGMYYLVAFNGTFPSELASAPSNDDVAMCPNFASGLPSLQVVVFDDKDGGGTQGKPEERGLDGVRVFVYEPGPDERLGTDDDLVRSLLTDADGYASFYDLNDGSYRVDVAEGDEEVRDDVLTTANDPTDVVLSADADADGDQEVTDLGPDGTLGTFDDKAVSEISFGFDDPPTGTP